MIDNLTGLMWPKNGNLMNGEKTWNDAIDYPKTLTLCGHSDWWLPNINELESLVNASLSTQGFTNVQSGSYWSSTTSASSAGNAWGVNMDDGFVNYSNKISSHYVWPVSWSFGNSVIWQTGQTVLYRAGDDGDLKQGVAWLSPRFTDQNNEEVADNLTGLVWTKDANLMETRDPLFDADATAQDGAVTWQHALDYVKKLNTANYLGHSDWRLPNRKELHSISDYSQSNPALPVVNPFTNVQQNSYYWSSSTYAIYKGNACVVYMNLGDVVSGGKGNSYYVWPVRTGQIGLVISKSGTGSGTVTSDPAGINCGSTCSASYDPGTSVTLTATAASGSTFAGWSGSGCSGTGTCSVTMDASKTISAVFNSVGGNVQTFPFYAGWNLISLPLQSTDMNIAKILSDISDNYIIVWEFTPPSTWKSYDPNDAEFSDLKNFTNDKGYWVKMKAEKALTISGADPSKTINLASGWNLIGYPGTSETPVGTALQSIAGNYTIVWEFTPPSTWKSYDPNDPGFSDLKTFISGKGYWIKMNAEATWTQ